MEQHCSLTSFGLQDLMSYSQALLNGASASSDRMSNKALGIMAIVGVLMSFQAVRTESLANLVALPQAYGWTWWVIGATVILVIHGLSLVASLLFALFAISVHEGRPMKLPMALWGMMRKPEGSGVETKGLRAARDVIKELDTQIKWLSASLKTKYKWVRIATVTVFAAIVSLVLLVAVIVAVQARSVSMDKKDDKKDGQPSISIGISSTPKTAICASDKVPVVDFLKAHGARELPLRRVCIIEDR